MIRIILIAAIAFCSVIARAGIVEAAENQGQEAERQQAEAAKEHHTVAGEVSEVEQQKIGSALAYQMGRADLVLLSCDKGLKAATDPKDQAFFYSMKGTLFGKQGNYKESLENYDKAVELITDDPHYWGGRAVTLVALGKNAEAMDSVDKALKLDPNAFYVMHTKGDILEKFGKFDEALQWYDKAVSVDSTVCPVVCMIAAYDARAGFLSRRGKYSEAILDYDHALKLSPDDRSIWTEKCSALTKMGKTEGMEICSKYPPATPSDNCKKIFEKFEQSADKKTEAIKSNESEKALVLGGELSGLLNSLLQCPQYDQNEVKRLIGNNDAQNYVLALLIKMKKP